MKFTIVAIGTFLVISLPYLYDPINYLEHLFVRPGFISINDFTEPPGAGTPMVLAVLFIVAGAPPELSEFINFIQSSSIGLLLGILPLFAVMLLEMKDNTDLRSYWRRMFYLSLLLVLWLHLWSPRGIFKYYLVLLIPFLTILASSRICSKGNERIGLSFKMIVFPYIITLLVLLPLRIYYLFSLFMIFLGYTAHRYLTEAYSQLGQGLRNVIHR